MDFVDFEHYDAQLRRAGADHDRNAAKIRELTARTGEMEAIVEEQAAHIITLKTALIATIRALAFSQTTEAVWFDEPARRHLTRAAHMLGLNLADLGLKYTTPADKP